MLVQDLYLHQHYMMKVNKFLLIIQRLTFLDIFEFLVVN